MSAEPRHAPLDLWRIAQAFLNTLHMLFGAPEDVAARNTLTRDAYKLMASWIGVAEALLSRLLLIEAAAYAGAPTSPPRPKRLRQRQLIAFHPDQPDDWRVSFRCFMERGRPRPHPTPKSRPRTPSPHTRFHSAWPLAERYEALIRVFNAPRAYARRLAQRLATAPNRLNLTLRAPPEYAHRVPRAAELSEAAESALRRRDSG